MAAVDISVNIHELVSKKGQLVSKKVVPKLVNSLGNIFNVFVWLRLYWLRLRRKLLIRKCNFISWPYLCFSLQRAGIYLSQVQTISSITLHNTVTCYLMKCDFFCSFFMNSFGESHHNYGFVLLQTKKVVIITNGKPRTKQVLLQVLHVLFKQSCLSYIHSSCH